MRQRGITLIEVLVSMAIIGMVASLMYTGFTQTARNKKRVEETIDRSHEIRSGLERMARELSMAYISAQLNSNEALQVMKTAFIVKTAGGGSRVDFTSFSHQRLYRDAHESDQNELSYFLADHPDDPERTVLARRSENRIDDDPQTGGTVQILIDDVTEFELSMLDPQSGEWTELWDSTQGAMQLNRLPSQVRIHVAIPDPRGYGKDRVYGTRAWLPLTYALNHAIYRR